ncbi:ATP synthase F1 subunit delta [Arcticibacter sp.]|jgi:F-type H+-transporting ATPase subunit delta|uniref:ATP synthase F1 subunit delta n=1 Tax=Arcticibacter sp. TaxID=1872630 RepID=UPI00388F490D
MSEIQVASRYANSLLDLAKERNSLEAIKSDLDSFLAVLKATPELRAVLRNPIISPDKKFSIIKEVFGPSVQEIVISFFKIVISKGRAEVLYETAKEFVNGYNRINGVIKASVVSAVQLTDENKAEIKRVVEQATQKKVVLQTRVEPDLIGGFVLTVGDKQFDASISSSLSKLKKEFTQKVV